MAIINKSTATQDLRKKMEDVVAACNRCGFCTSYCPTYIATGSEVFSPRGRNQMFRALLENKVTNLEEADRAIETCLLCGECTSICFAEVPTADLMVQARHMIHRGRGVPKLLDLMLGFVLKRPDRLKKLLRIAFFLKRWGVSWFLKKIKILHRWAPRLSAADDLVQDVPRKFLLEYKEMEPYLEKSFRKRESNIVSSKIQLEKAQNEHRSISTLKEQLASLEFRFPTVAYMPACGSQYIRPSIGLSTFALFRHLNMSVVVPDLLCCGLPAATSGVLKRVKEMAKENIERLEKGKYEAIVMDDSSCTTHLKEYPKYFQDEPTWLWRAQKLNEKVRELSSFLVSRGLKDELKKVPWRGVPVAYHDPCKAQYGQKVTQPPRDLLTAIPGIKLLSICDADQCCGGGGSYSFIHPEMSQAVVENKVSHIMDSGAEMVVTSSASCLVQLAFGLRKHSLPIETLHLTEFLLRALEVGR